MSFVKLVKPKLVQPYGAKKLPNCALRGKSIRLGTMIVLDGLIIFSGARGAPWVSNFGNPLIRKILVLTSAYVCPSVRPSVRPYRLWGRGRGVPRQPDRGRRKALFFLLVAEVNNMAAGSSYARFLIRY